MSSLTPAFWKNFAAKHWERAPLAVREFRASITTIDEKRVFKLLVAYADLCRKRGDAEGFKFYIDGQRAHEQDVLQILPLKKDRSLHGYHRRMSALFEDYCLVCDELLRVSHAEEQILAEFTRELYRHVGLPNRFSELGLYLGNYRRTPFGVHVDGCGVFSFPVVGRKKFRLWSPEYAAKNPELDRAFEYRAHRKASRLLSAGPGGMTYWPSSAWHIAESNGEFTATWSLGVWVDLPLRTAVAATTNKLLSSALGLSGADGTTRFTAPPASGEIRVLPESYAAAAKSFAGISVSDFREALLADWMVHLAKRGFKNTPDRKGPVGPRLRLADAAAPILWRRAGASVHCAFGDFFSADVSENLLRLIQSLNAGQKVTLTANRKGPDHRSDQKILRALHRAGALQSSP